MSLFEEPSYQLLGLERDRWLIKCCRCSDHPSVIRSGLNDALFWIQVHEDLATDETELRVIHDASA